ncbi:MAG TPA: hypothetical protein VNO34_09180 [Actinomycetota bacterium]|nr:hypothetical protein [Actinomycetota bacterium]
MAGVAQAVDDKGGARSLERITNLARLFWDDVADCIATLVKTLIEEFLSTPLGFLGHLIRQWEVRWGQRGRQWSNGTTPGTSDGCVRRKSDA